MTMEEIVTEIDLANWLLVSEGVGLRDRPIIYNLHQILKLNFKPN